MSFVWSREHASLLNALRSEALIPRLYRRLSRERFIASPEEIRRLRDWPACLLGAPGWAVIGAVALILVAIGRRRRVPPYHYEFTA